MSSAVDAAGNPIPTSAVLMASSKHIGLRCHSENLEFLKCKKKDQNPEKCLDKGRDVTRCVLGLTHKPYLMVFELTESPS
ncbi:NADH-ubiquinone oxidoreductase 19 kDa subunit family protein [Medicago truncatula]|uniref:NADH-ubiquinone oxidoreductase 19 kDa subunit family protein n=1 Tax=Medicago truncatula TaxID=3880 RepID=A0A072TNP2_MEDTR|nr:NADH-ubiquinone oxidoreductase 19 kDa subunit family protein [Medicago truncatula]